MHQKDKDWVNSIISTIPDQERKQRIFDSYIALFNETYLNEKDHHKKMNKARFVANSRLRDYAKRVQLAKMKKGE